MYKSILKNTFNELYHKYQNTDVRFIFSHQEIESSIQHVDSKVKEFTVLAYAEDQQIRVEDVAGDREKRKKRGWSDDDDSSVDSENLVLSQSLMMVHHMAENPVHLNRR